MPWQGGSADIVIDANDGKDGVGAGGLVRVVVGPVTAVPTVAAGELFLISRSIFLDADLLLTYLKQRPFHTERDNPGAGGRYMFSS